MTINGSPSLIVLVLLLVFMLLSLFGAIAVPFWVWVIWVIIAVILRAVGR